MNGSRFTFADGTRPFAGRENGFFPVGERLAHDLAEHSAASH